MRCLLLAIPLLIPLCAQAQTTAANPVEPFSYGVRVGTAKNPLIAALSSVVPSAQAGSTQAAMPVEMFSYGRRVGTQSNPIYVNLGNALDGYLPLTGGTINGNVTVNGHVSVTTNGYLFIASSNPDSNNNNAKVFFDTDNSLYTTNIGSSASHYMVSKFDHIKSTFMTGSGNAYACVNASGQLYRSSSACN